MNQNFESKQNNKTNRIFPTEVTTQTTGKLIVRCTTVNLIPIENAIVRVTASNEPGKIIIEMKTNSVGRTNEIELPAPKEEYSLEPGTGQQPYSDFNLTIIKENFVPITFSDIQILPNVTAISEVTMVAKTKEQKDESYVIPPHTLFGDYPPKIPEAEIKPVDESGEIVLTRVVIPDYIIVHDGPPSDSIARNYYVRFRDYIKNVACSEIYATWPAESIRANVLAILSFTLNRIYTEWYRNKGFNFMITSSTAYDHKWMKGRNIYTNIALIVEELFVNYLSRPNVKQPIFTQYCDGYRIKCPNWMSQWGSKDLSDQGYKAIDILKYYYGDTIYINKAIGVAGVPVSFPGYNLGIGATGGNVSKIQEQLNRISDAYPLLKKIAVDGIYGKQTANAVKTFQQIFGLPQTGVIDLATWYKISAIYVGVSRIAEL